MIIAISSSIILWLFWPELPNILRAIGELFIFIFSAAFIIGLVYLAFGDAKD